MGSRNSLVVMNHADDGQADFCEHRIWVVQSRIHEYRSVVVGPW